MLSINTYILRFPSRIPPLSVSLLWLHLQPIDTRLSLPTLHELCPQLSSFGIYASSLYLYLTHTRIHASRTLTCLIDMAPSIEFKTPKGEEGISNEQPKDPCKALSCWIRRYLNRWLTIYLVVYGKRVFSSNRDIIPSNLNLQGEDGESLPSSTQPSDPCLPLSSRSLCSISSWLFHASLRKISGLPTIKLSVQADGIGALFIYLKVYTWGCS
jgi:hypothetical protein